MSTHGSRRERPFASLRSARALALIGTIALAVAAVGSVRAQVLLRSAESDSAAARLSGPALDRYLRERMELEVVGRSPASAAAFRTGGEGANWRRWLPYQGDRRMDEETFFRRVRAYEWAQRAREYRSENVHLVISGAISVLVGGGAAYASHLAGYGSSLQIAGAALAGLGVSFTAAGLLRSRRRRAPFRVAYDASRRYNRELVDRLTDAPQSTR